MKKIVLLILATASVLLAANPAIKYLSSQSSTSILSLSGMSYWVAGQETDSQNLTNLGSTGAGAAQYGSSSGSDSNDPTALSWTSGDGDYVYLPGTSGNYLSHPDSAAVSVTGDITIQVECALDDWNTGSSYRLLSKRSASTDYDFFHSGAGDELSFWDGSTQFNTTTTLGTTLTDGNKYYLRVVVDVDNGASQKDVDFYYSLDGETFTQIGTTRTAGTSGSLSDTTDPIEIGSRGGGTLSLATGSFYSAHIWDSDIGSTATSSAATPVMNWRASSMTQSGGADEESGGTWTINRSSSGLKSTLVTRPVIVFNSAASTYLTVADHDDLDPEAGDFTIWAYIRRHGPLPTNGMILTKWEVATSDRYELYWSTTSGKLQHYLQTVSGQGTPITSSTVSDHVASLVSGARSVDADLVYVGIDSVLDSSTDNTVGGTSNADPLYIGIRQGSTLPNTIELFAAGVLKGTALTATQLATLKTELDALLQGRSGDDALLLFLFILLPIFRKPKNNVVEFEPDEEWRDAA